MPLNSNYRVNKMEVWMSSLQGRRPGSKLFRQNIKPASMTPQVTLHLDVEPPVLDTSGPKMPPQKIMTEGANTRKAGQFWNSLRNMYQSFCTGSTPVTWVNPEMVNQIPLNYNQPYHPGGQYLAVEPETSMNGGGCLWYAAPPGGSQLHYMDPLQVWPQKLVFPSGSVPQPQPPYFTKMGKPNRPLNPEAEEWIPKELREKGVPTPSQNGFSSPVKGSSNLSSGENSFDDGVCQDFSEITESEIDAVRCFVKSAEICPVSPVPPKKQKNPDPVTEKAAGDKIVINATSDTNSTTRCNEKVCENTENTPVSYAGVARKVVSSPEPPRGGSPIGKSKSEGIDQPIPKIFLKDKRYPKEKAPPLMEKSVHKLPFKTANKLQKKCSKKFLNELKASAQVESDCSSFGSEGSFGSPCSDTFLERINSGNGNICISNGSPNLDKLKGLCTTPEARSPLTQRSVSESSSTTSRIRSNSESSVASVDSINIEFEDEVDKTNSCNKVCIIKELCQPKNGENTKFTSSVADILGLNDSDGEWDDSDSDWDEVQNDNMLDDSWETFGLGLTISTCSKLPSSCQKLERKDNDKELNLLVEQNCDILDEEDEDTYNLDIINKRWNEEVEKDISVKTNNRVNFGSIKVHPMVTWAHAYQQARRGPWEQYARDAARFSRHIADLEPVISSVLKEKHRQEVYRKLYGDSSS